MQPFALIITKPELMLVTNHLPTTPNMIKPIEKLEVDADWDEAAKSYLVTPEVFLEALTKISKTVSDYWNGILANSGIVILTVPENAAYLPIAYA